MRKGIIIPLAALVVLAAGYFLLSYFKPFAEKTESQASTSKMLFEGDSQNVRKMTIAQKGSKAFTLARTVGGYEVEGMKDIELDTSRIDSAYTSIATLYASTLIDENPKNPSDFGFDSPSLVTAQFADGKKNELEIGSKTSGGDYYVRKLGEKTVYLTSSYNVNEMLGDLFSFRVRLVPGVNSQALNYVRIAKPGQVIELEVRDTHSDKYFINALKIVKPFKSVYPANLDGLTALMKGYPETIEIQAFIDNPAALSVYGLDKPSLEITFKDETSTLNILFGKSAGENLLYAKLPGMKPVVSLKKSDFDFAFNADPFALVGKLPFLLMIDLVDTMEFKAPGKSYSASISRKALPKAADAKSEDPVEYESTYVLNGKSVEEGVFKKIYTAVIGISIEGRMRKAAPPKSAKADVSLSFVIEGGKEKLFYELVSADEDFYALRAGGEPEFLITKSQVTAAVSQIEKLLAGGGE